MILTLEYARSQFDCFNRIIFSGSLQPIPIRLSHARSYLGRFCVKTVRRAGGNVSSQHAYFLFNGTLDMDEPVLQDLIIHEMIHYWVWVNGIDEPPHGPQFRAKMEEINRLYGRHVSVRARLSHTESVAAAETEPRLVCFFETQEGDCAVMVCPKSRLLECWDFMAQSSMVKHYEWYLCNHPAVSLYKRSVKSYYVIGRPQFEEMKSRGLLLQRHGSVITSISDLIS